MPTDARGALLVEYRDACEAFAAGLRAVGDRWEAPTPAREGNAGQVVDHVFASHQSLLLRPLDVTPVEPGNDRVERWSTIVASLVPALERPQALDGRELLVGVLATDVLVHSWDLSRAAGVTVSLDSALCRSGYGRAMANRRVLEEAGAIERDNAVPDDAPIQDRLLGLFGRNPNWGYPAS
ncbi:MAG TPA: hypothetical protein VK773_03880 [Acidimicrobiales bacterium]|nr:hypothetical protein [Acidimicrobiales bacterium]